MARKWAALGMAIAMLTSTTGFAQDDSGGAASGGVTNGSAESAVPVAPVAPMETTDQGPLPAGDQAGTATAAGWMTDPTNLAIGAAVIGAAICIAVCGSGQSSTSSTTTTTHK